MATIEQNLQKIISVKNEILDTLRRKGVTVPSNATLSDVPRLISLIQVQGVYTITYALNKYSVVYNLTNVTSNNDQLEIPVGSEFITTLTADSGYTSMHVIVQQGGQVIHEGDHGATEYVTIQSVTGDLIITATAM